LSPFDERELLALGYGITNIVQRATAGADELTEAELAVGAHALIGKVRRYRPRVLAVLGIAAYRTAFARPQAGLGMQDETIGDTRLWVLPNPSGLNAHYTLQGLADAFRQLRDASRL
jgi:TDG/mug DNA glycosylase family protein